MQGGGDDVVARLAEIDVVVGMDPLLARRRAEKLGGAIGDHLVGVHVGAGAGAGLEDVDHEVLVEASLDDLLGGFHNRHGRLLLEQAELQVDAGGALLDHPQGPQKGAREAQAGDREILHRPGGLGAVEGGGGNLHASHGVTFGAGFGHAAAPWKKVAAAGFGGKTVPRKDSNCPSAVNRRGFAGLVTIKFIGKRFYRR